jgi:hypothetical protein
VIAWLKKWWAWLVGGLVAVGGLVVAILTFWRPRKPELPPRPDTPDVELPKPTVVDTTPADDYVEEKVEPKTDDLVDRINRRHG